MRTRKASFLVCDLACDAPWCFWMSGGSMRTPSWKTGVVHVLFWSGFLTIRQRLFRLLFPFSLDSLKIWHKVSNYLAAFLPRYPGSTYCPGSSESRKTPPHSHDCPGMLSPNIVTLLQPGFCWWVNHGTETPRHPRLSSRSPSAAWVAALRRLGEQDS